MDLKDAVFRAQILTGNFEKFRFHCPFSSDTCERKAKTEKKKNAFSNEKDLILEGGKGLV